MKLKIATYNISSGFFKEDNSVDFFDKEKTNNIDLSLLNDIIKTINNEDIDVICFQEIITTESINYIKLIMDKTSLKYEEHYELSPCHIVLNTNCGIAILSKYPLDNSIKELFTNPNISKTTSSGKTYYSFDKGILISRINANNSYLNILTHHGFPFKKFNLIPEDNINTFTEFDNYIKKYKPDIITGDFNSENFIDIMPYTRDNYIKTVDEVTTTEGMKYDNILLKNNINKYSTSVIKSLSDHFIVINEIEF